MFFMRHRKKKFQNKCLLDVYIESVKKRFNINVLTFLLKYLINDSKKKILKTFFWVPLKKHLLNVSFET